MAYLDPNPLNERPGIIRPLYPKGQSHDRLKRYEETLDVNRSRETRVITGE